MCFDTFRHFEASYTAISLISKPHLHIIELCFSNIISLSWMVTSVSPVGSCSHLLSNEGLSWDESWAWGICNFSHFSSDMTMEYPGDPWFLPFRGIHSRHFPS